MKEIWKDIEGYEGWYQVSNFGRVRSLYRTFLTTTGKLQSARGKMLNGQKDKDGYHRVTLCKVKDHMTIGVHRLVAMAFLPCSTDKIEIDHIDTNITNNRVSNLRWVTSHGNKMNPITRQRNVAALKNRSELTKQKISYKLKIYNERKNLEFAQN